MDPLVLILLTCVVITSVAIIGVSLLGAGFFIYKAYVYYKAGGISKEEIHYHNYDHITDSTPLGDDSESWKHGDH